MPTRRCRSTPLTCGGQFTFFGSTGSLLDLSLSRFGRCRLRASDDRRQLVVGHSPPVDRSDSPPRTRPGSRRRSILWRRSIVLNAGLSARLLTDGDKRAGVCGVENVSADVEELVHAAFEKSWWFVRTDPVLADGDIEELRARLSHRLSHLAQKGERDVRRLANGAIFELRRELTAA